jgi:hypothetical protein
LAISLHSFTGQQEGDVVWLRWESITEDGAQRYRIERSIDLRSWQEIGELPARGTPSVYTFADRELPAQVGSVFLSALGRERGRQGAKLWSRRGGIRGEAACADSANHFTFR